MSKYVPFPPVGLKDRTWPDRTLTAPPRWCSVDLRDGNQALVNPMGVDQKLAMFDLLCQLGFKEIEVGFPSASQIEFDFQRRLIEEGRIPDDVTIQILCQARPHLIQRSLESLVGAKKVIFHLYNSTSPAHRKYTFGMTKEEIVDLAVSAVKEIQAGLPVLKGTEVLLEYSPESFTSTELDFALEICSQVHRAWGTERPIIMNLPTTVEVSSPNVHADQIEWFGRHIPHRDKVTISLHTHNDRGTGVASAELALMAGAQRVEGTLFGNGERTGNLDLVTLALNFYSHGVNTGLDFTDLPRIVQSYEEFTGMEVHPRHPYAGELVFTAFSGSHQDAIKKALDFRTKEGNPDQVWDVPYLPIDPLDIGRTYEAVIRINSQSGKGGVAYVLKERHGLDLPKAFHPEVGTLVNLTADKKGKELSAEEIWDVFAAEYLRDGGSIQLMRFEGESVDPSGKTHCEAEVKLQGQSRVVRGIGGGPLEAFAAGLKDLGVTGFEILDFHENAVTRGANSQAAAFVQIKLQNGKIYWGCALEDSITLAGIKALVRALNREALSPGC